MSRPPAGSTLVPRSLPHADFSAAKQACHQCRRRKLVSFISVALGATPLTIHIYFQKCDAQRPCATCVRSHANAIQTALPGAVIPDRPECTYDELPESQRDREPIPERTNSAGDGGIRSRYAQLEHRIGISLLPPLLFTTPLERPQYGTRTQGNVLGAFFDELLVNLAHSSMHSFYPLYLYLPSPLESRCTLD